jgi:hypothetical protein
MGLEVTVDPYLGQQPGDKVALNLNGQPDIVSKQTQSENDTVTLYLPKKLLFPDFVNRFTFTVTRGSQNMGTSEPLEVLYNAIRPGKEDTDPGVEGHSRLVLLLPDAIKNGVAPDFPVAGAQVCVSYPYCRAYDVIRLNCNGHIVVHTVTLSEAPLPGSDTPVTVCFTVTRADLASGGDSSEFVFSVTITDQLGNSPTPQSPWSAKQLVDVDLAGTRLPAPILREIQNDQTDDPSIIDRDKLAGNPLLVIVLTGDSRFRSGDLIEATYTATIPGQPDLLVIVTGTVETDEFGQKKPCILQVANDKVITNSAVKVAFTLERGGSVIASSKIATAQVIGSDTIALDPPVPEDNPVDPLAYLQGMTIQVAFAASLPGDQARLIVVNMPDPPTFADLPLDAIHQATFNLQAGLLGAWHGTAVQFVWALIRGGEEIARSGPLVLNVSRIANGDTRLPTPVIAGQVGQELDVTKLVVTDLLSIAQWLLQVAGQYVWLRYDGFNSSGAPVFFDDLNGVPHNETQGLTRPALVDWLKALKHGTPVRIALRVNFGKVADLNAAVIFPVREYVVKSVVDEKPVITEAIGSDGIVIPHGGTTFHKTVTLKGTASKGWTVAIFDGSTSMGDATADLTTGIWTKSVSGLSEAEHRFTAKALYGSGQVSEPRNLTVVAELIVDTSPIHLSGAHLSLTGTGLNWTLSSDPPGTSIIRPVTGGVPPYSYSTSDDQTASVDSRTGTIRSVWNGTATITITDDIGQQKTIEVTVSNVARLFYNPTRMTVQQAAAWITSIGGRPFDHSAVSWPYGGALVRYHTNNNPPPNTSPAFNAGWKLDNNWAAGYFTTPSGTINGPGNYAFETMAPGICFRQT